MNDRPGSNATGGPNRWGQFGAVGEALRFLTILPIPGLPAPEPDAAARSVAAFPIAGIVIGAIAVVTGWLAGSLWNPTLRAIVVVATNALVTGGLHLDGVADSCDAFFSWRSRERMLEIMKDSRIGTMGALGLLLVVAFEVAALVGMGSLWWKAALLAPIWGRLAMVCGLAWFPAAGAGLGQAFHQEVQRHDLTSALLLAVGLTAVIWSPWGLMGGGISVVVIYLLAQRMSRSLGGLTGDTYGALAEAAEIVVLLVLLAVERHHP